MKYLLNLARPEDRPRRSHFRFRRTSGSVVPLLALVLSLASLAWAAGLFWHLRELRSSEERQARKLYADSKALVRGELVPGSASFLYDSLATSRQALLDCQDALSEALPPGVILRSAEWSPDSALFVLRLESAPMAELLRLPASLGADPRWRARYRSPEIRSRATSDSAGFALAYRARRLP